MLDNAIPAALQIPEVPQVSVDGNTLTDELTITDPEVLAKTWNRTPVYRRKTLTDIRDMDSCLDRVEHKDRAVPAGF